MWKLDFVWRSANQVKLPRKFLALDYQRCSRPHCLRQQKKAKQQTRMTNPAHNLLDQLMNEVKKNLVDHQIEKMKTEILNVGGKKK